MEQRQRTGVSFFLKMAAGNLRRNRRMYLPYFIAATVMTAVYFMTMSIVCGKSIENMTYGNTIQQTFLFGSVIMTVFVGVFMLYLNSFLLKRRKKEFGLYGILGLQRTHVAQIILWEGLLLNGAALVCGILLGTAGGHGIFALLLWLLPTASGSRFVFDLGALGITAMFFAVVFCLGLLINLLGVRLSNPIDLLNAPKKGEKKPRFLLPLTLLGLVAIVWAYYTAFTVTDAIQALFSFTIAVLAVIFGTYCLFLSGSVFFLDRLKKRDSFYYKKNHFVAVSGMLHRMKQNAAGLATICILSTMVLVTVGCCVSLFAGKEQSVRQNFPNDMTFYLEPTEAGPDLGQQLDTIVSLAEEAAREEGVALRQPVSYTSALQTTLQLRDGKLVTPDWEQFTEENRLSFKDFTLILQRDFNRVTGEQLSLGEREALWLSQASDNPRAVETDAEDWPVTEVRSGTPFTLSRDGADTEGCFLVLRDEETLRQFLQDMDMSGDDWARGVLLLNVDGEDRAQESFADKLRSSVAGREDVNYSYSMDVFSARQESYGLYGGLLFLGTFFAVLFLTATVLIIYFKQVSEGYEDRERFEILEKVGMDDRDIKKTINTQILLVFFLPLGMALLHLVAAGNMLQKMMEIFYLNNIALTISCLAVTALVFIAVYVLVYRLTARTYYRLVK